MAGDRRHALVRLPEPGERDVGADGRRWRGRDRGRRARVPGGLAAAGARIWVRRPRRDRTDAESPRTGCDARDHPWTQARPRYAPGPAKRFAQAVGALFTLTATELHYGAGLHTAAFALIGVLALFASLEAALGLCIGCQAFYLGMRLGFIPPSACENCARVLAASSS